MTSVNSSTPAPPAPTRGRGIGLRLQIALVMVLIAILGAITAYRGAVAEMESALLEQKLDQGRLLELYFRQDRIDGTLLRETLSIRKSDDERMAQRLMQAADAARARNDADNALWLDLEAQEEIAAGRALRQVFWMLPSLDGDYSVEQTLRQGAVQRLNPLGFEASWSAPPAAESETPAAASNTIWAGLEGEIKLGHARVPLLAFGVAGFVAALVLLTMADISRKIARKRALLYTGGLLGLLPAALAIAEDAAVWPWFAGAAVAFAALVLLGWRLGALQDPEEDGHPFHPAELEYRSYAGAHLTSHGAHGRLSQCAVLAIAITVLLSALVGARFSTADTHARQAALNAVGYETDMLKRGSLYGATRTIRLQDLAQALEQRARLAAGAARQALLPPDDARDRAALETARMRSGRYDRDAFATIDDPKTGLQGDPIFPRHSLIALALAVDRERPANGLYRNAWEAFGNWEAARTESVEAHEKAVVFLATLTVFAVAVYLFGQALGMSGGRAAVVLVGLGVVFVAVGTVGAVRAEFPRAADGQVPAPADCALDPKDWGPVDGGASALAARQFGIGVAMLDGAYAGEDYDEAIRHLRCAARLRPDFAEAKRRLATVLFSTRSSQMHEDYVSLPGPDALKEVLEDEESAVDELEHKGLSPSRLRASLAFDGALSALADHDRARLDTSVLAARKALEELPASNEAMQESRTLRQFNLAVILLAHGERAEALAAYRSALGPGKPLDTTFLFSAITDLHAIEALRCPADDAAADCKTLREDVDRLTADIVGAMRVPDSALAAAVAPGSLTATATSASLSARLRTAPGGKPAPLVLLWYGFDPRWKTWHVLPDPSGPARRGATQAQGADGLLIRHSLAEANAACVAPGRYRVEAYAAGTRIGETEFEVDGPRAMPVRFPELNLVLCAPAAWQRWQQLPENSGAPARRADRLEDALFTLDGRARLALYLRTVPGPRSGRDVAEDLAAAARDLHADTWKLRRITDAADCAAPIEPGVLLARAWRTTEGTAHLALAPAAGDAAEEACQAIASVSTYFRPLQPEKPASAAGGQ